MLSTRAWCNPNQILAHYPQNREMNQRALLPAIPQGPEPGGRPGQRSVLHSCPAAYKPSDCQTVHTGSLCKQRVPLGSGLAFPYFLFGNLSFPSETRPGAREGITAKCPQGPHFHAHPGEPPQRSPPVVLSCPGLCWALPPSSCFSKAFSKCQFSQEVTAHVPSS